MMTTSNEINLDYIRNYFSLNGELEQLNIAPTATGGAGINNLTEFPAPKPCTSIAKVKETNYVARYLHKAQAEVERRATSLSLNSSLSINNFEDVENLSTAAGDVPQISDLDLENTKQLYSTYYSVPNNIVYNPDLNVINYREQILQLLNINPVVIIEGPTGCGKTTQVPQYILDYHAKHGKYCNIIVTQPRKIAAISIANRVCQERRWQLGTFVGYQIAMDPKVSADTRLSYVTTGVLLEKLVDAKNMSKYTHVIIDEVHERDQDIDFALLLVKKFLMTNSGNVKVILMSATFNTSMFAEYFSLNGKDPAPIVEIYGKTKEVTEHYLQELESLLPNKMLPEFDLSVPIIDPCLYDIVLQLMYVFDRIEKAEQSIPTENEYAPSRGAVLIFLPGYDEISILSNVLSTARFNKKFWIIPLHSMITLAEQSKVFTQSPPDHRKVIISTNIAESSITVPDIKYVIDFCLTKSLMTDPQTNYTCLELQWASKANCTQRKGRAGRVDIGKVYRMVPRYFYNEFADYSIPEIKRCPLTKTILHLKKLEVCDPYEMLAFALDPPYSVDIENAILQLKEALALYGTGSSHDGDLTFIGNVVSSLPVDIKLGKLILFGYAFSCLEECIIIAASLSLQSFFARPFLKPLESYRSRLLWANYTFSDCFAYLNAYKMWNQHSTQSFFLKPGGMREKEWCEKHYIQIKRIKEVHLLVKEIQARLEKNNIYVHSHQRNHSHQQDSNSDLILKIVIAGAFFPHYFIQESLDELQIMREVNDNDPMSTVIVGGLPRNHGLLYACALKDMFACCSDEIDIDFDERNAYIKFGKHEATSKAEDLKLPSLSIQPAVYFAVKMRLLRMPMKLSVFSHDEAERKMQQIRQLKDSNPSTIFATNRYSVKLKPSSIIQKIELPGPEVSILLIFITHYNNCGHFWARYVNTESDNRLSFIEYTIFNFQKQRVLQPLRKKLDINMLCLAPYQDIRDSTPRYYRAEVCDVKNDMVKVHFVDYGNEELVKKEDLREICQSLPDVINTPALAFECFLSEIKPSSNHMGAWSDNANMWFRENVSGKVLRAKVYSVVQNSVRLELLLDAPNGTVVSINEKLISKGFAEKAEESLLSKQNHEFRQNCMSYHTNSVSQRAGFSSLQVSLEDVMGFSNLKTTSNKVNLHGPSNPLEASYAGFTYVDRSKCVKIERDSVNSVSFNAEPQDKCCSMLVASNLTIGQKSDVLHARNTTLMPKIQGLPTLICLLFSPYSEIRTNKAKSSYTGALCGLGFDPINSEPLYRDHDIELEFDIEIILKDICDINAIRMGMNMLLQPKDETNRNLIQYKKMLRENMLKLLQKKRAPYEPQSFNKVGHWNQFPSTMLLQPLVDSTADNPHVLPLLKPPSLLVPQTLDQSE